MNKEKKTYYLTTPIYYPSDNLHLGHTYTTIIADTLKKFKEIQGYDVQFITGTDEHGKKIAESAAKAGQEPMDYINPIVASAKELWEKLDIKYDNFVRSTDEDHQENVQKIFQDLYDRGEIYKSVYKGHYCIPCESFWSDSQLNDGNCPDCNRPVEYQEEESYFFRLSNYTDRLLKLYEDHPEFLKPDSRKNEMINNFLSKGLDDLSVSRSDFDWGVKVPFDEEHVIYVWTDALACYLTGIGYGQDEEKFNKYWPADVHFVGKEIVRFHAIIWPAILMALDLPVPKQIFGHGWILFDEDKMSKSKGNIVYPEPIIDLYGVDALKYFILREWTFGSDGNFTIEKFLQRLNSDLCNDLGNLVSRTTAMIDQYFDGVIKEPNLTEPVDDELKEKATKTLEKVEEYIEDFNFSMGIEEIWKLIRRTNKYIDETKPWVLGKEGDEDRLSTVLYNLADTLRIITILIKPFITETSEKIKAQLKFEDDTWEEAKEFGLTKVGTKIERAENLFPRLDIEKEIERLNGANDALIESRQIEVVEEYKEEDYVTIEEFDKLKFKVADILSCEDHPNADKLYVFQVKIGNEERQIVSGIKEWYKPEDLVGKKAIVITNLKPIELRGEESNGMILSASDDEGNLTILTTMEDIKSGSTIS